MIALCKNFVLLAVLVKVLFLVSCRNSSDSLDLGILSSTGEQEVIFRSQMPRTGSPWRLEAYLVHPKVIVTKDVDNRLVVDSSDLKDEEKKILKEKVKVFLVNENAFALDFYDDNLLYSTLQSGKEILFFQGSAEQFGFYGHQVSQQLTFETTRDRDVALTLRMVREEDLGELKYEISVSRVHYGF